MAWYDFPTSQAHGVNGERGIDIQTPMNTPLTALFGGTVVSEGYHTFGGEVDILTTLPNGQKVIEYFIHLNDIASGIVRGTVIKAGQVIGVSGGQTSGGDHPATTGSTGPHTEFGLVPDNASHSVWVGTALDPTSTINAARAGTLATGDGPTASSSGGATPVLSGIGDFFSGVTDIPGAIQAATQATVAAAAGALKRISLVVLGLILLGLALVVLFHEQLGTAAQGAARAATVAA